MQQVDTNPFGILDGIIGNGEEYTCPESVCTDMFMHVPNHIRESNDELQQHQPTIPNKQTQMQSHKTNLLNHDNSPKQHNQKSPSILRTLHFNKTTFQASDNI